MKRKHIYQQLAVLTSDEDFALDGFNFLLDKNLRTAYILSRSRKTLEIMYPDGKITTIPADLMNYTSTKLKERKEWARQARQTIHYKKELAKTWDGWANF